MRMDQTGSVGGAREDDAGLEAFASRACEKVRARKAEPGGGGNGEEKNALMFWQKRPDAEKRRFIRYRVSTLIKTPSTRRFATTQNRMGKQ